jgi:alpha-L-fucosidase
MVRTCEFIDKYQPKLLYFDWWIQNYAFKPYLKKIAAYYYNRAHQWGVEVSMNYKREAFPPGVATFDVERGALTDISPVPWQTCTAIGKHSWGYTTNNEFKTARQIICDLIDIVSKNGMLLLNVGPRSDGTITDEETALLLELGAWLQKNGEGIYDTVPWKWFGEGGVNASDGFFMDGDEKPFTAEDFRFTYKAGAVYAMQMRPDGRDALIRSFSANGIHDFGIETVELLGYDGPLTYTRDRDGLRIILPADAATDYPLCFRITLQ